MCCRLKPQKKRTNLWMTSVSTLQELVSSVLSFTFPCGSFYPMVHGSFLSLSYWWPLAYLMHLSFYLSFLLIFLLQFLFYFIGGHRIMDFSLFIFLFIEFTILWLFIFLIFYKSFFLYFFKRGSSIIFVEIGKVIWRILGNCLAGLSSFLPFLSCARQEFL